MHDHNMNITTYTTATNNNLSSSIWCNKMRVNLEQKGISQTVTVIRYLKIKFLFFNVATTSNTDSHNLLKLLRKRKYRI